MGPALGTLLRFSRQGIIMNTRKLALLVLLVIAAASAWASRPASVGGEMAAAAEQFLAALSPEQRAVATIPFEDENRTDWHFIPRSRRGVPLKALSAEQQKLAHAWVAAGLSREGHAKATNIIALESVLFELENQNATRDSGLYYLTLFGKPSDRGAWGWRFEGHHLSLNFTLRGGRVVSASPLFYGANPAVVPRGPKAGVRTLPEEELTARKLLRSFQGSARAKVIINSEAPADIITSASRKAEPGAPVGVVLKELSKEQADALLGLVRFYASRLRSDLAEEELDKVHQAGLDKIHFAWAGGTELGEPHYYRIQGPTFLIEYDNTQNNANHIHTVWRSLQNDFGYDALRAHYDTSPHHEHAGR